jgi:hypothetical protein
MAVILAIDWQGTSRVDIHAIKGVATRSLADSLFYNVFDAATGEAKWMPLAELRALHPSALPVFKPRFVGTVNAAGDTSGHGVEVNHLTGIVTTPGWPTTPRLWTFVIEATVLGAPTGTGYAPLPIRVQLHDGLQDLWLTPSDMRIRPSASGKAQRFTALATFTDGTVGDVTEDLPNWGATWSEQAISAPPPGPLPINSHGWMSTTSTSGWWTVTVDVPALGTGTAQTASADVGADDGWGKAREATFVAGAGPGRRADVPNVLFIAEGYTDGTAGTANERRSFDDYVAEVVRKLGTSAFRPYDLVAGSMNFWSVFVGSWAAGTSIRNEHKLAITGATAKATPVPLPTRPAGPALGSFPTGHAGAWTLEEMIYELGLPVPAYEATSPTPARRETDWKALYDARLTSAQYSGVLAAWQALGSRALLDETGTAFGTCFGGAPTMAVASATFDRSMSLNARRASRADVDELGGALLYKGTPIGAPLWGAAGKDRKLVCLLSRSRRYGGAELPDHFLVSIGGDSELPCTRSGSGWTIDPKAAPAWPFLMAGDTARVLAHECGHALGLQDEYGGGGTTPCPDDPVTVASVNGAGNLLHAKTVVQTPAGGGASTINLTPPGGASTAWASWPVWPRIAAAGATFFWTDPGDTEVLMEPGHLGGFTRGATVQLRTRDLLDPDGKGALPTYSTPMVIDAVDATAGKIILRTPLTGTFSFPEGSLLIAPVLDAGGAPLPLLSKIVKDHIELTDTPVNRAAGASCAVPVDDSAITWAVNLPTTILRGTKYAPVERIVGLYDGGMIYNCGVFHATGACLMRGGLFRNSAGSVVPYTLCHVCRYILVDKLDPRKHAKIDSLYQQFYPL